MFFYIFTPFHFAFRFICKISVNFRSNNSYLFTTLARNLCIVNKN